MTPNELVPESRVPNNGYYYVRVPNHPKATSTGYVYEHRLVMEQYLGRFLTLGEVVHHKNEIRTDNRLENLELKGTVEHLKEHGAERTAAVILSLKCPGCGQSFERLPSRTRSSTNSFCGRSCNMSFNRRNGKVKHSPPADHGSCSMYTYHKCRCLICKRGQRDRARAYRARKKSKSL